MAKDTEYVRLINSTRWRRLRAATLAEHPLCVRCKERGLLTPASEVHHRQPVETGRNFIEKHRLAYDPANLMPLCHECHRREHDTLGKHSAEERDNRKEMRLQAFASRFLGAETPGGQFLKQGAGALKPHPPPFRLCE